MFAPVSHLHPITASEMLGQVNKSVVDVDRTMAVTELLASVKTYMRIDYTDDDALLSELIDMACTILEDKTGFVVRPTSYLWTVKDMPTERHLVVDGMPLQNVIVTDTDTVTDVTLQCEITATYEDFVFYLKPPEGTVNFTISFSSGLFSTLNIWTVPSVWTLPDVWNDDSMSAELFDKALIRQAIYVTVGEFYKNRELTTQGREITYIPSVIDYVINPIRRIYGA